LCRLGFRVGFLYRLGLGLALVLSCVQCTHLAIGVNPRTTDYEPLDVLCAQVLEQCWRSSVQRPSLQ